MQPDFSETSYAFALMSELADWPNQPLMAAPVFPSLQEEGNLGYDAMINRGGMPMFLQFKLSEVMVKRSAMEVRRRFISHPPFYRMKLHSRAKSRQHELLLNLEWRCGNVFYAAPEFHTQNDLNQAYINRTVSQQSRFTAPREIGGFTDDEPHHIAFERGVPGFVFCSEPESKEGSMNGDGLASIILERFSPLYGSTLAGHLREIVAHLIRDLTKGGLIGQRRFAQMVERLTPLEFISHVVRTYYGAEMLFVMKKH